MIDITDKQWDRLWTKVDRPTSEDAPKLCWEWGGSNSMGVPQMFISNGKGGGTSHSVRRIVWENTRGEEVAEGHIVTTNCRNKACVNPNHLVQMTRKEQALQNGSPTATNAGKTHCKNGHEFTEENTYVRPDGRGRQCRTCTREIVGRHRKKKAAERAAQAT